LTGALSGNAKRLWKKEKFFRKVVDRRTSKVLIRNLSSVEDLVL
jgi:hypothetical protein